MALYLIARNCDGIPLPKCLTIVETFAYLRIQDGVTVEEAIAQARSHGIRIVGSESRESCGIVAKRVEGDRGEFG